MPFGLTYAAYVMGVGLTMVFGPPDSSTAQSQSALSLGTVVMPWADPGSENFLTFSHTAPQLVWGGSIPFMHWACRIRGRVLSRRDWGADWIFGG